jgi:hypothetical protein
LYVFHQIINVHSLFSIIELSKTIFSDLELSNKFAFKFGFALSQFHCPKDIQTEKIKRPIIQTVIVELSSLVSKK